MREAVKRHKWLMLIVLLAAVIRLWQLGNIPPSPDWDEAALGYNAFSILKTGRDEYGTWFPLALRSFDDYKPPLYMYLTVPSVALFGLSVWSVRLPSVAMGVLSVIGTYLLTRELLLLRQSSAKNLGSAASGFLATRARSVALTASFLLALSPWAIQFSRIAFEANSAVTLNIWAVYFFLRGLRSRYEFIASSVLFALSLYAYHSQRIFAPLLVLSLLVLFRREVLSDTRRLLVGFIAGIIVALPLLPVFFDSSTLMRLRGTSSLADQTALLSRSVRKIQEDRARGDMLGALLDNRRLVWAKTLAEGYLSHFSLRWLFLTGDNPRHHAPDMGLLYLTELPFFLWGLYAVASSGMPYAPIVLLWFFLSPVAASPTTELPHGIRTLVFLPTFQIFTSFGIWQFIHLMEKMRNRRVMACVSALVVTAALGNVGYFADMYFVHMNHEVSEYWQYGYKEAISFADSQRHAYRKIVVSTKLEQPHMFFLFYLRYDPVRYLREGGTASGGFAEVRNRFDVYEFRPIKWEAEIKDGSVLYIGKPEEIPAPTLMTIAYLDGTEAIRIADR